jgi:hypothetical protein
MSQTVRSRFTPPERDSFKPAPLRASSNPLNYRAFNIRTKMAVVRLRQSRGSVASEKVGRERRETAQNGPVGQSRWFGQTAGKARICAVPAPDERRKKNVPNGEIGGGRGARPETFSTFEHTRAGMLQGSRFECRSGQPGRTLWCLGAPTRTCCGVTQGVKLRGQRRRAASLAAERGQGRRGRLKYVKARRARHSEAAKEADRPQPKGDVGRTVGPAFADGSTQRSHRAIESSLPTTYLDLDQLGKPHGPRPTRAVSRPRGRGTGQGERMPEKAKAGP